MVSTIDIIIVFGYLFLMLLIGFFVSRKEDLEGYFVNNRRTKTLMLLTTTVSTAVGAGTIIGLAGVGYQYGIGFSIANMIAVFLGYLVVAFFAKRIKSFGDKKKALTSGDFYADRYSKQIRLLFASILGISTFFWMAAQFVAMGNLFSILIGWSYGLSLLISAAVTVTYVTLSGIKSDFYTDFIQFWIMFLLFILLIPLGLNYIGGIEILKTLPPTHFNLFTYGGPILFFGVLLFGIPSVLVGMDTWQRIYAATDEKTARKTFFLASVIHPIFYAMATFIGLIAAIAFTGINQDSALFKLMQATLPTGLLGIGLVSLLAIVMSTLDSAIVIVSAIFTKDFYKSTIKPTATDKEMLKMGRLISFVGATIALGLAFILPNIIQLAIYGITIMLTLMPSMIGALLWKRATNKAAILSISISFPITLVLIFFLKESGAVPSVIISSLIFVVISFLTKHSKTENVTLS